jgi:uncharacterized membrane protein
MGKGRLEAFSDGVIAIIITIMVLELQAPHSQSLGALHPLIPKFLSYALSFIFIGIYWNNHHHLLHTVQHVDGRILWANLHLLFWLSLVPFATDWIGESNFGAQPVAIYGVILLLAAIAFTILVKLLIARHGKDSMLAQAVGEDRKGKVSMLLYVIGITGVLISPWIGVAMYIIVALIWLVPDRRIAKRLASDHSSPA